jgi:putative ABC transport system permease protein
MLIGDLWRRLRFLVTERYFDGDIEEEMRLHLALREKQLVERGLAPDVARREARERFGRPAGVTEQSRNVWGLRGLETFGQDVAYAFRRLRLSPAFTLVSIAALALGIGATTAIFSVVDAVLLRSLPFTKPDRLVMVWEDASWMGFRQNTPAPANYVDWTTKIPSLASVAALDLRGYNVTGGGAPEKISAAGVTANFFETLGVPPVLGRTLGASDDRDGGQRAVVIGHALWQRRFGGDSHVLGKDIQLNGARYAIVGVMPPRFSFPFREVEAWVPCGLTQQQLSQRGSHYLWVVGRLRDGHTLGQANAELQTLAARLAHDFPDTNRNLGMYANRLLDDYVGDLGLALKVLLGAVALVLLIMAANLANVLLARGAGRTREMAVRAAIGAGAGRLVRQILTENLVLALAGGLAGLAVASAGAGVLRALVPDALKDISTVQFDWRVLTFATVVALVTGVLVGLVPARQAVKTDLASAMKLGAPSSGRRHGPLRAVLVIAEVAGAMVLVIAATLMIESFATLRGVDPGFRTDHVLSVRVPLTEDEYPTLVRRVDFTTRLLERARQLPGVQSAGITSALPLVWKGGSTGFFPEGTTRPDPKLSYDANNRVVTPGFMETMRMSLVEGRLIDERDTAQSQFVVVINETMARQYWPNVPALGRRLKYQGPDSKLPWFTIVGIVRDVRSMGLDQPARPEMYFALQQSDGNWMWPRDLVVRADGNPRDLANAIRQAVLAINPSQPISDVATLDDVVDREVEQRRVQTNLLGGFAGLALVLACLGIYGVLSLVVSERTQEIGLRMALGADRQSVLRLVMGGGMKLALAGVAAGLIGAYLATGYLERLLFGVRSTDPWVFAGVAGALLLVSLVAVYIPARRASLVDPLISLRAQ